MPYLRFSKIWSEYLFYKNFHWQTSSFDTYFVRREYKETSILKIQYVDFSIVITCTLTLNLIETISSMRHEHRKLKFSELGAFNVV